MEPPRARQGPVCGPAGGCDVVDLFRLLGKAHVLHILFLFRNSEGTPMRFNEVQKATGMSPNTLSERLKDLVEAGLLTRTAYNEIPPRVDYAETEKARELGQVFRQLCAWSEAHDLAPVAAPAAPGEAGA